MTISCIICAFNEAPRIGAVLAAVSLHPLLDEIIVVDDGSADGTAEVVARNYPGVRLIRCAENRGKSFAMSIGVAAATYDTLMLLDADLADLAAEDVNALARPVLSGRADISISLRGNSLLVYRLLGLDFVSGERVLRKDLLSETLAQMRRLPRFGLEVFMNERIIARRLSIAVVCWSGVVQARKTKKLGPLKGALAEVGMLRDVFRVTGPVAAMRQMSRMRALRTVAAESHIGKG